MASLVIVGCDRGKSARAIFEEAQEKAQAGDWEAAVAGFNRAIELDPRVSAAYAERAMAETRLKRYDNAIADCDRAIALNPKDAYAYRVRGLAKSQDGKLNDAINDFLHAIRLDPTNAIAFYQLGYVDCELTNLDERLPILRTLSIWVMNRHLIINIGAWRSIKKEILMQRLKITT